MYDLLSKSLQRMIKLYGVNKRRDHSKQERNVKKIKFGKKLFLNLSATACTIVMELSLESLLFSHSGYFPSLEPLRVHRKTVIGT